MKTFVTLILIGSVVVGMLVLVTAAAAYSTGKYHLTVINLVLFVWTIVCARWADWIRKEL